MAGISEVYAIGGQGGFLGGDGVNPVEVLILVGHSDRMWFEPRYFDRDIWPIGRIQVTIPAGPEDPNALIDACLAFYPDYFSTCEALWIVQRELADWHRLDFDADAKNIPPEWDELRDQARPLFEQMHIWHGKLAPVHDQPTMAGDDGISTEAPTGPDPAAVRLRSVPTGPDHVLQDPGPRHVD